MLDTGGALLRGQTSKMASTGVKYLCTIFFFLPLIYGDYDSRDYLKREHSLVKPYSDVNWDFTGSTIVTNNFVRLTPDRQSMRGAIWNTVPCRVRSWELHVHFKVHGTGRDTLFGDGFAVWYTKNRMTTGEVFGNKDYFSGLGIFFDTYSNHNGPHAHGHPYISAMVNNGTLKYDHDRDGTHTELAGCEAHFRGATSETYVAVRYEKNKLTVSTDIDGSNSWKQCFSADGVRLPTGYFIGATATTGDLADNHDIISLKLYDIVTDEVSDETDYSKIDPSADIFAPPRDHINDNSGGYISSRLTGWRLLVIIIVAVIGVGVCAMVGFIIYTNQQEGRRKRFY